MGADLILIPTVNTKTEPSDQGQETVYESAEKRVLCVRKATFKFSKSSRPALRKFTVQQVGESEKEKDHWRQVGFTYKIAAMTGGKIL